MCFSRFACCSGVLVCSHRVIHTVQKGLLQLLLSVFKFLVFCMQFHLDKWFFFPPLITLHCISALAHLVLFPCLSHYLTGAQVVILESRAAHIWLFLVHLDFFFCLFQTHGNLNYFPHGTSPGIFSLFFVPTMRKYWKKFETALVQ